MDKATLKLMDDIRELLKENAIHITSFEEITQKLYNIEVKLDLLLNLPVSKDSFTNTDVESTIKVPKKKTKSNMTINTYFKKKYEEDEHFFDSNLDMEKVNKLLEEHKTEYIKKKPSEMKKKMAAIIYSNLTASQISILKKLKISDEENISNAIDMKEENI